MRFIKLLLLLMILSVPVYSQDFTRTFDSKGANYQLSLATETSGLTKITVVKTSDKSKVLETSISPFSFEQFSNQLSPALKTAAGLPAGADAQIESVVQNLFYDSVAHLLSANDEDGPVAGTLTIKPTINSYLYKGNISKWLKGKTVIAPVAPPLDIEQVQLEVFEGFIENISVKAREKVAGGVVKIYSNEFGIGFASKNNMGNLHSYFLIEKDKPEESRTMINLGQLISFDVMHAPGRRDYSPKDDAYIYTIAGKEQTATLKKSPTKRLIEARVYSDFIGLNQDKPNGLIQTEISKRINTNTNRGLIFPSTKWFPSGIRFVLGQGGGLLQYVIPTVTLSKLEENNRSVLVHHERDSISKVAVSVKKPITDPSGAQIGTKDTTIYNSIVVGKPYVTALELMRNQNFSAGLDFNILYSENVGGKFNFYLDGGLKFGRTSIKDSTSKIEQYVNDFGAVETRIVKSGFTKEFGVNTFQIYPHLKMQWLPDERFGVTLSRKWTYFKMWNGEIENGDLLQGNYRFASDLKQNTPSSKYTWINTWELFAFLKLSENGKLFFRYKINYEAGHRNYNFNQAQVGYSFYILGNRNSTKEAKSSE